MVALDPKLLEVLVCPDCRAHVEHKERRKAVVCLGCGLQFPVQDGVPQMLVELSKQSRR